MSSIMNDVPIGHSVLSKECVRNALGKIKDSTCVKLTVKLDEKEGYFVVCKGRVVEGKWDNKEGEEAWNELIEEASKSESVLKINFYPPPEGVDVVEEMSADALAAEDVGSEYIASVSVLALGKAVLGIIHRLNALGIEFDDIKVTVRDGVALVILVNPHPKPSPEQVRNIASLYLSDLGIKEVEVEIA